MNKQGFTLIELLIVVTIIGVLAALILPNIIDAAKKAKELTTQTTIKSLEQPLREYAKKDPFGRFPDASDEQEGNGTVIMVKELRDDGFFQFSDSNLTDHEPYQLVDGWNQEMRYHPWKGKKNKENAHNKKSYDLWSAGENGEFEDTEKELEDNITNWSLLLDDEKD